MSKIARYGRYVLFAALVVLVLGLCVSASATVTESEHNYVFQYSIPATCKSGAQSVYRCSICGDLKTETISQPDPTAHTWGAWETTKEATCTTAGERKAICSQNHHIKTETIPALGHSMGPWQTTQAPTCTTSGQQIRNCSRCSYSETQILNPTGHAFGPYTQTTAPTCTTPGVETSYCANDTSHTQTRPINALGHLYGAWQKTQEPTCTTGGSQQRVCARDSSHVETEPLAALGHAWGPWNTTVQPTCTATGTQVRTCQRDPSHTETQTLPTIPHQWTAWTVTKQPTFYEEGERTRECAICHTVQTEKMPRQTTSATICSFGPRLKDVNLYPNTTDLWYMFTPFDASINGPQTYELVGMDRVIVGNVTINIRNGIMTVDYSLKGGNSCEIYLEFFTVLNSINDLPSYEPEGLLHLRYNRNQPIDMSVFGDDTHLVLYFCSRARLTYHHSFLPLNYTSTQHQALLSTMMALMD